MKNIKELVIAIDSKFEEVDRLIKELHAEIIKLDGETYINLRRETCDLPRIHMRYYLTTIKEALKKIA